MRFLRLGTTRKRIALGTSLLLLLFAFLELYSLNWRPDLTVAIDTHYLETLREKGLQVSGRYSLEHRFGRLLIDEYREGEWKLNCPVFGGLCKEGFSKLVYVGFPFVNLRRCFLSYGFCGTGSGDVLCLTSEGEYSAGSIIVPAFEKPDVVGKCFWHDGKYGPAHNCDERVGVGWLDQLFEDSLGSK